MSLFKIENLRYYHVGPINLSIGPGECVCISGASGTGKSLLLRTLIDLEVHEGNVYHDNIALNDSPAPEWRQKVALLPAESAWWFDRVGDHFKNELDLDLITKLGFPNDVANWEVSRLSTGEKQRLALCRILENKPKVLLLDEPTSSLDPDNIQNVERILKQYINDHSVPTIWISHFHEQIKRVADQHYILENNTLRLA